MKAKSPVVIMIDDRATHIEPLEEFLRDYDVYFDASQTLETGWNLFKKHSDASLVIVNGCVNSRNTLDSLPLIRQIRASGYVGHLMAKTGNPNYEAAMLEAGCSLAMEDFSSLPQEIVTLLNLQKKKMWWQFWR